MLDFSISKGRLDSRREFTASLHEDANWAEAMNVFFDGLLAMGYTLTREDFREIFQEEFHTRLEAVDEDR